LSAVKCKSLIEIPFSILVNKYWKMDLWAGLIWHRIGAIGRLL
jgi:hypothetical protein